MSTELSKFEPLKAEIAQFVSPVKTLVVTDFKSSSDAVETAKRLKSLWNMVDAKRKELVGPLNDEVKRINEYVKFIVAPLDDAEAHIKRELNRFATEQEMIRRAEQQRLDVQRRAEAAELCRRQEDERTKLAAEQAMEPMDAVEAADLFGSDQPSAVDELAERQRIEAAQLKASQEQARWDIDQQRIKNTRRKVICDVDDINLVPKEFLIITINEKAAVAAHKAGAVIPGLLFREEFDVAIGQKTRVPAEALNGR